jgi:hypothetical protein
MPRGSNRPKGAPALPGAGRPPQSATIRNGAPIRVLQGFPDGGVADLGAGVAEIVRQGQSRIILLPQDDGSIIRIWVF